MARSGQQQLNLERDVARVIELLEKLQRTEYNAWLGKDVSVEKLRQLHKVLRSDFFSTVRQVYEKVYDSVEINGSPDIRANACAKATVAVFAASDTTATQPRLITLPKTEEGLGFNIMGGKEQGSPIYISRIIPGGLADRQGGLKRGDQLLAVNGITVEGESHERAVDLLKAATNEVSLVVRHTPRILDEMESRYDQIRSQRVRHVK